MCKMESWRETLGASARAFLDANADIKRVTKQLKPKRDAVKGYKSNIIAIMLEHEEPRVRLDDYGMFIAVEKGVSKRAPNAATIRERCHQLWGEEKGESVANLLLEKVQVDVPRFRTGKLKPTEGNEAQETVPEIKDEFDD